MVKKKILIAPNSFKECIDAVSLAEEITTLLKADLHNYDFIQMPVSDGGDGFLQTIKFNNRDCTERKYTLKGLTGQTIDVPVLITGSSLYIESALVIGLKLLPPEERNPLNINTAPLGELLRKIDQENTSGTISISIVIIGIGGTATNDLGLGMLSKFGLELLSKSGEAIPVTPLEYIKTDRIKWNTPALSFKIEAVTDVNSPLTGESGTAALFAAQKGASEKDIGLLEDGFLNILRILDKQGILPGAEFLPGAGGGLAAGLNIFLNAGLKSSLQFIEVDLGLNRIPDDISVLITGEGGYDLQSSLGKGTGIILNRFSNTRTYLICGNYKGAQTEDGSNLKIIELQKYFNSKEESILNIHKGIRIACGEIISELRKEV